MAGLKAGDKKRLVLIDGHAILHRAYHALPPLTTRSGELVNAVYGFCTILLKVIDDLKPSYLAVAFDTPKTTFRHNIFIGYQAKRPKMAEELSGQIEKVYRLLRAFEIPVFAVEGYEADDVIATIALKTTTPLDLNRKRSLERQTSPIGTKNLEVIIVSGDRDLFQLVGKRVKLYMPLRGISEAQMFGEKEVEEKMGIKPEQIVDYKALVGDSSDNYPGVSGIGPKTAVELLKKFGSFDKIYRALGINLDGERDYKRHQRGLKSSLMIPKSIQEKLIAGFDSAVLSWKLAKVVTNVPIIMDLKECRLRDFNKKEVIEVLKEFGFKSLITRVTGGVKEKDKKGGKGGSMEQKKEKVEQRTLF